MGHEDASAKSGPMSDLCGIRAGRPFAEAVRDPMAMCNG